MRFAVQASLTRLFDTAAQARSRRFRGVSGDFPWFAAGNIRARLVLKASVLSSRRPGQDKNPEMAGAADRGGHWGHGVGRCFSSKNLSWYLGRRRVDGVEAFLFGCGPCRCVAGRVGQRWIFGK